MSEIECQVSAITPLTESVFKVVLKPKAHVEFKAGQYILVHMGKDDKRPFSIASPAYDHERIELHIGADKDNTYASEVLSKMRKEGCIKISGGHGEAFLRKTEKDIILIAGGTGFSYTHSILQQFLHEEHDNQIHLYWGGKTLDDLYMSEKMKQLATLHPHFTYVPVIEEADDSWKGHTGYVHHAVMKDFTDMSNCQIYVAGRFEMAKAVRDDYQRYQLNNKDLFGDAFAFI
ncbi:NAD(P)H-flavin reductase [Alteromonas sp. ASW11-130]|uniref:NAD(P)H-flavin reductase n=1 Tax=Alteromonas sp. ASW11-130 TaxID=3015775 RepID=UPI0022425872|nr:NAD(P)H-flavin reductase [Alteromonas sp. ASW11-130]MCW8090824.1 NAD(P)H-flavin reductase [Alteromonas sp. ASW11-130]